MVNAIVQVIGLVLYVLYLLVTAVETVEIVLSLLKEDVIKSQAHVNVFILIGDLIVIFFFVLEIIAQDIFAILNVVPMEYAISAQENVIVPTLTLVFLVVT